ncbi:MAG: plasmid pRiA4b ORF-3 family protein, partial [Nitrosospira sp.]
QAPVYQLRVELLHIKPAIWRQLVVPGTIKLSRLHVVLLWTMGWEGSHLHEFVIGDTNYGQPDPDFPSDPPMRDENNVTLTKALDDLKSFTYVYDYGDHWQHRVQVEQALPPDPKLRSAVCLAGRNACPPEDVGGAPGYIEFLEAITDPAHESHQHLLDWCGGSFDSQTFDCNAVNQRLRQIKL